VKDKSLKEKKIKEEIKEKKSSGRNRAATIIQKFMKKNLYPFINRVSSNIYSRINYYKKIIKRLNINKKNINNYCIIPDKEKENTYHIGDIILKKRIGSNSVSSIVFLSSFKSAENKIYKYASKLYIQNKKSKIENSLLQLLSNAVISNKCPHFPIMYGNVSCNNYDLSLKLPAMINKKVKPYGLLFVELANGDLNSIMYKDIEYSQEFYMNTFVQCILSILFFYKHTNSFHFDAHGGNFLYHNIKKGGYFHYKILDKDFYLENIGYLWIIWDYEYADKISNVIKKKFLISTDLQRIVNVFLVKSQGGFITNNYYIDKKNNNILLNYRHLVNEANIHTKVYKTEALNILMKSVINYFITNKLVLESLPTNATIINSNNPYIINSILYQ
jgi:hypothetical protein